MKKWLFLLCCAFSLLLNAASGKAVPSSEKKILVLASFHLAHDWTAKLTDTIQADSKNFSPDADFNSSGILSVFPVREKKHCSSEYDLCRVPWAFL